MRRVAPLVRLVIQDQPISRTIRLCDLPHRGELIQLGDGTRVVVETVETCPDGDEADVEARTRLAT